MKTEEIVNLMRNCKSLKQLQGFWMLSSKHNYNQIEALRVSIEDELMGGEELSDYLNNMAKDCEQLYDAAVIVFAKDSGNTELEEKVLIMEAYLDEKDPETH